jgi:cellobiose-specific phosphotransferase system component IIB
MVELRKDIEAAAIGNGAAVTGSSSVAGNMRGLYGWIATNNSLATAGSPAAPNPLTNTAPTAGTLRALAEADLRTVITAVYANGGDASVVMVSPQHKVKISTFTGNVQRTNEVAAVSGVSKSRSANDVVLQTAFNFYGHDFGVSKVVPNRVMTGSGAGLINTAYILDYDKVSLGQLRPFESEQMATTGDAKNWQIRSEVTLIVRQESTLGAIRDLTATGS